MKKYSKLKFSLILSNAIILFVIPYLLCSNGLGVKIDDSASAALSLSHLFISTPLEGLILRSGL